MTYHCPHCGGNVLSRRSGLCSYCLNSLPSELLPTAAESEAVETEERERKRRREERQQARLRRYEEFAKGFSYEGG